MDLKHIVFNAWIIYSSNASFCGRISTSFVPNCGYLRTVETVEYEAAVNMIHMWKCKTQNVILIKAKHFISLALNSLFNEFLKWNYLIKSLLPGRKLVGELHTIILILLLLLKFLNLQLHYLFYFRLEWWIGACF